MTAIPTSQLLDANGRLLAHSAGWNLPLVSAPTAFAGGTTNARGDNGGTSDPLTLFTVTGVVLMKLFGVCSVNLAGATATLEVGTVLNPAGLIAQTTATNLIAGELWHDATPDATLELATVLTEKVVAADVIETVGTADITAGNVYYVCSWYPLTPTSRVTSSYPV